MVGNILCFFGFHKWEFYKKNNIKMKKCKRCGYKCQDLFECPFAGLDVPYPFRLCNKASCKNCPVLKANTKRFKKTTAVLFLLTIQSASAAYLPLPIMRQEYTQAKQSCLDGIMPPETEFAFVYDDYCGCVAQEIVGATKNNPEWLRDPKFNARMQPIIASAYQYCDQYTQWKTENSVPYVKPKKNK